MQSGLVQLQHSEWLNTFKSRSRWEQGEYSLRELFHKTVVQLQSERIRVKPN